MQKKRRKPADSPVVTDTTRVAVRRALIGAPLLALAAVLFDLWAFGAVGATDVLLGLALGLLAGPLTLAERAARLGRPWAALTWGMGLGVVGVLVAAVQAGFSGRVLAQGAPAGVHAAVYTDVWLAALDPATVVVVVARVLPFAIVPLALTWRRRLGVLLLVAVLVALVLDRRSNVSGLQQPDGAWGLPTGARAPAHESAEVVTTTRIAGLPVVSVRAGSIEWTTLWAASFDLFALTITFLLGETLARRGSKPLSAATCSRSLPLARLLPTLGVVAVTTLLLVRHRPPPAFMVDSLIDSLDDEVRRDLSEGLLDRLGPDDAAAVPVLALKLADPTSPRRREAAAVYLQKIGAPANLAALPALGRALSDADPEVRDAVLATVTALGPAARPIALDLVRLTLDEVASFRGWDGGSGPRASDALTAMHYEPTLEDLRTLMQDPDGDVAGAAIAWLDRLNAFGPDAVPLLYEAAQRPGCVDAATEVMMKLGAPAVSLLGERLAAADLQGSDPILRLLGIVGSPEEQRAMFITAARHPVAAVRQATADRLRAHGRAWVAPLLAALAVDEDESVRDEARRALAAHGAPAAAPLAALVDARGETTPYAIEALTYIGGAAAGALPALTRALADGEPWLRTAALRALGKIGPFAEAAPRDAVIAALVAATRDPLMALDAIDALRGFMSLNDPLVREALFAALDSPSTEVRARAAVSLVLGTGATRTRGTPGLSALDLHLERIVPALVGGLPHDDAYEALWTLGPRAGDAAPALARVIEAGGDVSGALRALAAIGLEAPGTLAAVGHALRKGRRADRLQAISILRAHGTRVSSILDDLVAALADSEPQVRRDVVVTLDALDAATLARVRPQVEERLAVEEDPQTGALLQALLRKLDGAR